MSLAPSPFALPLVFAFTFPGSIFSATLERFATDKTNWVYILASRSQNLYPGITGNLQRRLAQHRLGLPPGSTSQYRIFRWVYCEAFTDVRSAIAREKRAPEQRIPRMRESLKKMQVPHTRPKCGRVRDDNVKRRTQAKVDPSAAMRSRDADAGGIVACIRPRDWDITARGRRKTKLQLRGGRHNSRSEPRIPWGLPDEDLLFGTTGVACRGDRADSAGAG